MGLHTPIALSSTNTDATIAHDRGIGPLPDVPILRTLRSHRFRLVTALLLIGLGVAAHLVFFSLALSDGGSDAGDFNTYRLAAIRLAEGDALYSPEQLSGAIDATAVWAYLYPPLLAQVLAPFVHAAEPVLSGAWYALQLVAIYAATWLASGLGGARRSVERALWTLAAVLLFLPVVHTLWFGNVSGFMALGVTLVAFGGATAGLATALMILVKVSPIAFVPAVAMMGRRALATLLVSLLALVSLGLVLAPQAWMDYPAVLQNLMAGSTDYDINLAPATMAARAGLPDIGVSLVRGATLFVAAASLVVSAWVARRDDGRMAAVLLGTVAMLLAQATLWYHYLVVLLPLAAMAWPRANPVARLGLLVSAGALSLGMAYEPLALLAAVALLAFTLPALWPAKAPAGGVFGRVRYA